MEEDKNEKENDLKRKRSNKPDPVAEGRALFIRNMGFDTTEQSLRDRFQTYGQLTGAFIVKDKTTGRSTGKAFVHFKRVEAADAVLEDAYRHVEGLKTSKGMKILYMLN
jgi:RNA recognition motif-containing protein